MPNNNLKTKTTRQSINSWYNSPFVQTTIWDVDVTYWQESIVENILTGIGNRAHSVTNPYQEDIYRYTWDNYPMTSLHKDGRTLYLYKDKGR